MGSESRAPKPPPRPERDKNAGPEQNPEEPMLYCPRCSARLVQHRCKLVCERCGYYMSCADYY